MGIQQKLLLFRANKRIDRVVSQYLKVLQNTDINTSRDGYMKFVSDIKRTHSAPSSDKSGGGGVYNDESVLLFAKRLCLPVQECKFLERMGTRLVLASISKESGDALLTYLRGLHDMCREYANKYHCTERSIEKAMSICDDVLNGVQQDDRSMLSAILSGVTEKLRGCSSADSVVDEILSLLPSSVLRDLQATCGLSGDDLRFEVLRIHKCLSRKDTSTRLRKHVHAVMNIFSRILNQGKAKPILGKITSIMSIMLRGKQSKEMAAAAAAISTTTGPSYSVDIPNTKNAEEITVYVLPDKSPAGEDTKHENDKKKREPAAPRKKRPDKPKTKPKKTTTEQLETNNAATATPTTATDAFVTPSSRPSSSTDVMGEEKVLKSPNNNNTERENKEDSPTTGSTGAAADDPKTSFDDAPKNENKNEPDDNNPVTKKSKAAGARRSRRKNA